MLRPTTRSTRTYPLLPVPTLLLSRRRPSRFADSRRRGRTLPYLAKHRHVDRPGRVRGGVRNARLCRCRPCRPCHSLGETVSRRGAGASGRCRLRPPRNGKPSGAAVTPFGREARRKRFPYSDVILPPLEATLHMSTLLHTTQHAE